MLFGKHTCHPANAGFSTIAHYQSVDMNSGLTEEDRLVKPEEAAILLALSRRTLRRYELSGRLHPIKLNKRVTRYRMADLWRLIGKEVTR